MDDVISRKHWSSVHVVLPPSIARTASSSCARRLLRKMKAPTVSLILFSLRLITASEGQARIGEIGIAVDNAGGDLYERGAMSGVDADSEAMGAIRAGRRGASESEEMGAIRTVARTVDLLQEQNELLVAENQEVPICAAISILSIALCYFQINSFNKK